MKITQKARPFGRALQCSTYTLHNGSDGGRTRLLHLLFRDHVRTMVQTLQTDQEICTTRLVLVYSSLEMVIGSVPHPNRHREGTPESGASR
jgi:hypothetical protein